MSAQPTVFASELESLPRAPREELALDHEKLFLAGLEHVKRLSSLTWTDYNFHDPGITMLELICYALTDLGYRASLPIADRAAGQSAHSTLFPAHEILPPAPLTQLDLRQLLVDCAGVANAWLIPASETWHVADHAAPGSAAEDRRATKKAEQPASDAVLVRGLWRVLLDVEPGADAEVACAEAATRLAAARNLCEEFAAPEIVLHDTFRLCAEIEVAPGSDLAAIAARVLRATDAVLAPRLYRYTLAERLAARDEGNPVPIEEIFAGPLPQRGFVLPDDLERAELRERVELSDVYRALHAPELSELGVIAVRDLILARPGERGADERAATNEGAWSVAVRAGRRPALVQDPSHIVFLQRGIPLRANSDLVRDQLIALGAEQSARTFGARLEAPTAQPRALARYTSLQNHFPETYGLSHGGPQRVVRREDEEAIAQLKSYLLFFDQLFANYLQLLAAVPRLLSSDPALRATYAAQAVDSFWGWERAYGVEGADDPRARAADLATAAFAPEEQRLERRHRFLDHLTARFAETFHELAWVLHHKFGSTPEDLARVKCAFLADVPALTRERGLGANLALAQRAPSGFERRLAALLGLPPDAGVARSGERFTVIENLSLRPRDELDPAPCLCVSPSCPGCEDHDPYSFRIHVALPAKQGRFADPDFRRLTEAVVREETPAHVLPKVCWLSDAELAELEAAHARFLAAPRAAEDAERKAALGELLGVLFRVRSIHPPSRLTAPSGDAAAPDPFVIGRARLGTQD